jgi:hypothetical protein
MPGASIYSCRRSQNLQTEGLGGLEDDLDEFLGSAGEVTGSGAGAAGWNVDLELDAGVDAPVWLDQLFAFLRAWGLPEDTYVVIPADDRGTEARSLAVFSD